MRNSSAWVVLGVLVVSLAAFWFRDDAGLSLLDRRFAAWIEANTPNRPAATPPVVLVGIDEAAIDLAGGWPWRPLDYALFLRAIEPFKPSVVVIDHPLVWRGDDRQEAAALEHWALRARRLVLACAPTAPANQARALATPRLVAPVGRVIGPAPGMESLDGPLECTPPPLSESVASAPLAAWRTDGEPAESVGLLLRRGGDVLPALPLEAARLHLKIPPSDITVLASPPEIEIGGSHSIALVADGRMPIDFSLLAGIRRISHGDLLVGAGRDDAALDSLLGGGIVVLGRTGPAADAIPAITGHALAPAELVAVSLATLLAGTPPMPAPPVVWMALSLALCLFAAVAFRGMTPGGFMRLVIVAACAYFALATSLLYHWRVLLPVTLPVLAVSFLVSAKLLTSRQAGLQGRPPRDQSS